MSRMRHRTSRRRAMIGLRMGNVARWSSLSGSEKAAEMVAVLFQPESSGDCAM